MQRLAIVLLAVVTASLLTGCGGDDDDGGEPADVSQRASDDAEGVAGGGVRAADAGCTPVEHEDPIPVAAQHLDPPIEWEDAPPNSGDHMGRTLPVDDGFYERDDEPLPEQAVHDLEHGLVVAWYDTELPDTEVDALRDVTEALANDRFVAVPWNREPFEGSRHFVLTAWGHTQRCERVSGEVVDAFTRTYADRDAPENGFPV